MKKLLLLFAALLFAGCGEKSAIPGEAPNSLSEADVERLLKEAVDYDSLEERDGLYYENNEPFSGWVKSMYDSGQVEALVKIKDGKGTLQTEWHENGQKQREASYKDGEVLETVWHENGQKEEEGTYKDGDLDDSLTKWYENGQKRAEGTFKDGKQDGPFKAWHENGQKMFEGTYKDNNQVGLSTGWHENGQKAEESTFKDSDPHGLWIRWHENGQKQSETIWENAQKVSVKYWNSKGEEVETEEEANE